MIKCVVFGCWNMAPNKTGLCARHRLRVSGRLPKGEDTGTVAECVASQSGGEAVTPILFPKEISPMTPTEPSPKAASPATGELKATDTSPSVVEPQDMGVSATPPGSREPDQQAVPALRASIPDADNFGASNTRESSGRVVCRFSCGAASAVATKLALTKYPNREVVIHYSDTRSEHPDNERFLAECETWFGRKVERLTSERYHDVWDVWARRKMIVAGGTGFAPCTEELKRMTAEMAQRPGDLIVLGYTAEERHRLARVQKRNPGEAFLAPLIDGGLTKSDCLAMISRAGIALPVMYSLGFKNNNCLGCPRGGMGYWNNIRRHFPEVYDRMARLERGLGMAIIPDGKAGKRVFLDELDPGRGEVANEPDIECSIMCELAEQDLAA